MWVLLTELRLLYYSGWESLDLTQDEHWVNHAYYFTTVHISTCQYKGRGAQGGKSIKTAPLKQIPVNDMA